MKYLSILLIPLYSNAYQLEGELEISTGPGFLFSYVRLLPTPYNPATNSFLQSINEQTAWNLFACLAGAGTCKLPYNFSLNTEIEGGWLRHGQASITDSSIRPLAEVSVNSITEVFANVFKIHSQVDYHILLPRLAQISIGGGYQYNQESERFTYINQDLIIFSRVNYQGPYLKIAITQEFERLQFFLNYKLIAGKVKMVLTQKPNPFNTVVCRSIPQVMGNIFSIGVTYRYNDCFSVTEKILYSNAQNHARGRSTTYQSGLPPMVLHNVDSVASKELLFLTSITYDF